MSGLCEPRAGRSIPRLVSAAFSLSLVGIFSLYHRAGVVAIPHDPGLSREGDLEEKWLCCLHTVGQADPSQVPSSPLQVSGISRSQLVLIPLSQTTPCSCPQQQS